MKTLLITVFLVASVSVSLAYVVDSNAQQEILICCMRYTDELTKCLSSDNYLII